MSPPSWSSCYPMADGNGVWCQGCNAVIDACPPNCIKFTPRPVKNQPLVVDGRFC